MILILRGAPRNSQLHRGTQDVEKMASSTYFAFFLISYNIAAYLIFDANC